jgi:YD repeat-containing protein
MISHFRRPKVAAFSLAIVFFQTAAAHAATPERKLPKTPCDSVGSYKQFPGVAPSGKNCGNGLTTLVAGPITLYLSSMQPERAKPVNRGFGKGVTFGAWIVFETPSTYVVYDETGASTSYTTTSGAKYFPEDRVRGNLNELTVTASSDPTVTLTDPRTNAKTEFTKKLRWDRYLPTKSIAPDGIETELKYDDVGVPVSIEDKRTNQKITFVSADGLVQSIKNTDDVVTTLSYDANGYLTSVIQADDKVMHLTYKNGMVTRLENPDKSEQSNTYYDNGVLESSSTYSKSSGSSITVFVYAEDSVVSTSYPMEPDANGDVTLDENGKPATKPLKFSRVVYKDNPLFGKLATEVYAADGAYSTSNPGVLLSSFVYGSYGQLAAAYDQFGLGTLYFYNRDGSCTSAGDSVPESPLPTCIKTKDDRTKITYNDKFLPLTVYVSMEGSDKSTTVSTTYDPSGHATSQTLTNAKGETIGTSSTTYAGKYPSKVETTSVQTASYDNLYRPTETRGSDGSVSTYTYGKDGRIDGVTVDGVKLKVSTYVAGSVETTVEDGTMTTTVLTSADGLGYGVTTKRMEAGANQIAQSTGMWGGISGDQSARAAFDISRLKRMNQDEAAPAQASEIAQLKSSSTMDHFNDTTTVSTGGITRETNHQLDNGAGSILWEGSSQKQDWPGVEKANGRKKKHSHSSSGELSVRPPPRFLPGAIPGR